MLGVVYNIDGNGIGERITAWLRQCVEQGWSEDTVLEELRAWSARLDQLGRQALSRVVQPVTGAIEKTDGKLRIAGALPDLGFELRCSDGQTSLPVRPVLVGGDDLTFLCDGRIALDLAEARLDTFSVDIPFLGRVTACAGAAIVPAHAPFDHAYELPETLCGSAKARRGREE